MNLSTVRITWSDSKFEFEYIHWIALIDKPRQTKLLEKKEFFDRERNFLKKIGVFCFL